MTHNLPTFRIIEKRLSVITEPFFEVQVDRLTQIPFINRFKLPLTWWTTLKIRFSEQEAKEAITHYLGIGKYETIWNVTFGEFHYNRIVLEKADE